ARPPLREFGPHPRTGAEMKLMEGRYGAYVTDGTTNATLPKSVEPAALTMEEAAQLLDARAAAAPPPRKGAKKAPVRKTPAKAAADTDARPAAKKAQAKPATKKPATSKPATGKPAARKPAVRKAAAKAGEA
ncbi:topoisomerase C-terminal repeat-containing protein, partial [Sphingomonas bacterium]|uniref:topoisomerase C-terminal repeat-containing protein n=1 Tax=Sphingomonas bacterium TaxID=1895847 RepID=UPI00266F1D68